MNRICVLIFSIAMLSTNFGSAQTTEIDAIMSATFGGDAPGAALLIEKGRGTIIKKGYGLADLAKRERISAETQFRMASVSKHFTAMCIVKLHEEGKLKITDKARKYLPNLPAFSDGVTLQHLMDHTSGITDYEPMIPKDRKQQVSDADVLALVCRSDSLYFPAGSRFKYSNTGFCLLTQVVEAVTGTSYRDYIRQNLFIPAGMEHSVIYDKDAEIFKRAFGYRMRAGDWQFADQSITSATMGDGSVYTSLDEYRKWLRGLWARPFKEKISNPFMPHASVKTGMDYGYGWFIAQERDGSIAYFHSGETTGFRNIVYHNPSKELMIMLFSNGDNDRVSKAFDRIGEIMEIRLGALPEDKSLFMFLSRIYGE